MRLLKKYSKEIMTTLSLLFIISILIINVIGTIPSFDGAMNAQVSENLCNNGIYSVNYPVNSLFDQKIQTGITVILPTAIIFKIFGKSLESSQIINVVYIIILLSMVFILLKTIKIKNKWILLTLIAFLFTPHFFDFSMGLYGEIPTLVWIMASIILLEKNKSLSNKYFILSGALYGLAYLTKVVSLIGIPSILFVFLYKLIIQKDIKLNNILFWILGFVSPVLMFEVYKLIQLGIYEYYISWKELIPSILMQAGVKSGMADTSNKLIKLLNHIKIYSNSFNINPFVFILVLLSNFGVFCGRIYKERKINYFDILFLIGFSYFGWWLIITSDAKAWARRIIIGTLTMEIITIVNAAYLSSYTKIKENTKKILYTLLIIIVVYISAINIKDMKIGMYNRIEYKESVIKFSNEIKSLGNDSEVLGFGWWQAPVISFESNKIFKDYNKEKYEPIKKDTYLVVDSYAKTLGNDELKSILNTTENELIYFDEKGGNYLYKIKEILPYEKFTIDDISEVRENNYKMEDNYDYLRGSYNYEDNSKLRWSKQNSCLLLKNNLDTDDLEFKFSYQISFYERFINKEPIIEIYINDQKVYSKVIVEDGVYNESININNIVKKDEVAQIEFKFSTSIDSENDSRELAFILRDASLIRAN